MAESKSVFENIDLRDLDPKEAQRWWDWGKSWLKAIRDWWKRKPEYRILVAGAGGVGKSTLAKLLNTDVDFLLNDIRDYVQSWIVEKVESETEDEKNIVHVLPGQEHRRSLWDRYIARLKDGYYNGVILMGCYGYHSLGPMQYEAGAKSYGTTTKDAFLQRYLPECRRKEIDVAKSLFESVITCNRKKIWVLTIVSKQDLWSGSKNRTSEVATHYHDGEYNNAIQELLKMPNRPDNIRVETMFCSLLIQKLCIGSSRDVLCPNVEGYDHFDQVFSLIRLFGALNELRSYEEDS